MTLAIRTEGLSRTYGEGDIAVRALRDINLEVEDGEFGVLLGPSGSGKTTLLNVLGAIDTPTSGDIFVDGVDLGGLDRRGRTEFRRGHVGFVFQFFNLIPTLTALENVELITELTGRGNGEAARKALRAVGLEDRFHHFPSALSGGEQQRVSVARAVAGSPRVLLADEPTGALDMETGRLVLDLIRGVSRSLGITVLLVTHNAVVGRMADRVIRLRDGQITTDERNKTPADPLELEW